jgi:hypothetical protein
MLREIIFAKRADRAAADRDRLDRESAASTCDDCFGVGLIRVPHPSHVVNGEVTRPYFIAIACNCSVGNAKFNSVNAALGDTDRRLMDVGQYEALVPDWREVLVAYQQRLEQESIAAETAARADRMGPITTAGERSGT